jgi:hypothetical protein
MSWNLSSYFPEFDGPEMRRFKEALAADIASLKGEAAALPPLTAESAVSWEPSWANYESNSSARSKKPPRKRSRHSLRGPHWRARRIT